MDSDMAQNAEVMSNSERTTDLDAENDKVSMAGTIIGMLAYIFLVVPILTFTIVAVLNLSGVYVMAVAIAFVITGLYVTEKFACLNT